MTILVTGGLGYIGSNTSVLLLEQGYDIVIVDNLYNSQLSILDDIENITGKKPKFYNIDVADKNKLEMVFKENNIQGVINFASYKAVGESVSSPLKYYSNNITGLVTLLEAMKKYNVKNFIFSSSATVYGGNNISPLSENMPTTATNPYGSTKLFSEQILKDLYNSDNSFNITILRYFNPIGSHKSGLLIDNPNGIPNNLMPYIVRVSQGKLKELSIYGNDYDTIDGTGVRDYIHVEDLANGHLKALENINNLNIYNLGTGTGYSVLQIINVFEKVNNTKIPYKIIGRRDGDVATCYANSNKASKELNWEAKRTLEDMCMQ